MAAKRLLAVSEVAEAWGCCVQHVYNLIAAGHLTTVNIGMGRAKTRIHEDEVARYIKANTYGRASA